MARLNAWDRLRPVRRAIRGVEVAQVLSTGRSVVSVLARTPVLVVETVGNRTGRRRRSVVAYHRLEDGDLVVVGGAAGQASTPDWVANLRAEPHAVVIVDRRRHQVTARELVGIERMHMWRLARTVWPRIDTYERRAGRPVPVFRLSPCS